LTISIDATNSGEFTECASINELGLGEEWATSSYVGISATTGELSDNHDIISFDVYGDDEVALAAAIASNDSAKIPFPVSSPETPAPDRLLR